MQLSLRQTLYELNHKLTASEDLNAREQTLRKPLILMKRVRQDMLILY
jgi:hypothetical protein